MSIRHTLYEIPLRMNARDGAIDSVVQTFLADIAARVDRGMVKNLSGSGGAGEYPVPRRTGHLARSSGHSVRRRQAVVWNAARYARAVHDGFRAYGNPNAPYYGPRPFLSEAVASVDPVQRLQQALAGVP